MGDSEGHKCLLFLFQLSAVQLERRSCPHCSKKMETDSLQDEEEGGIIGSGEEIKDVNLDSSKGLLSQLHSLRHSPPSTNGQDLEASDSSLPNAR